MKLADDELFKIPFVIMTGSDSFNLTAKERGNLKKYLENGGFLLSFASCSNEEWGRSFEREIKQLFGNECLKDIPMNHELYRTIFTVKELKLSKSSGIGGALKGITHNAKIVIVYTPEGLNDSSHAENCCCCGGNEIQNAMEVNANILAYALLH